MLQKLAQLDRRWIFLLVLIAVSVPLLLGLRFPERPSGMVRNVFQQVEGLEDGSVVLMAFDYDPPSQGELRPMAAAFTRHCAEKRHKMIFLTLWPQGTPMIQDNVEILKQEYPDYKYGRDYVNLGFRPGQEGVIRVIVNDLEQLFANDVDGTSLRADKMELTKNLKNIQQVDLVVNVSAGTPGAKEWVQYAATPYQLKTVVGTTGVGAPTLYPYYPDQLNGILGAIKAAAEYEQTILEKYPDLEKNPKAQEALRRMGPQLIAHVMLIGLIVLGNVIYFAGRNK